MTPTQWTQGHFIYFKTLLLAAKYASLSFMTELLQSRTKKKKVQLINQRTKERCVCWGTLVALNSFKSHPCGIYNFITNAKHLCKCKYKCKQNGIQVALCLEKSSKLAWVWSWLQLPVWLWMTWENANTHSSGLNIQNTNTDNLSGLHFQGMGMSFGTYRTLVKTKI